METLTAETSLEYVGHYRTMRGLYAIVDAGALEARGIGILAFAEAALSVPLAALQLRAKDVSARQALTLLRELAPMCRRAGVPLVANDRPDLAVLAGCDLVHVGQDDMPIDRVRRIAPGLRVGVSTHTIEQLEEALAARPDYVAFGPVFATSTKKDPAPIVGVEALRAAHALARVAEIPLVAIGGITQERAVAIVGDAEALAVVAALIPPAAAAGEVMREVASRARRLADLFAPALRPTAS
jgi:thiamine-phosphate pyrophosphorylase